MFEVAAGIILAVLVIPLLPLLGVLAAVALAIGLGIAILIGVFVGASFLAHNIDGRIALVALLVVAIMLWVIYLGHLAVKYGSWRSALRLIWVRVRPELTADDTVRKSRALADLAVIAERVAKKRQEIRDAKDKERQVREQKLVHEAVELALIGFAKHGRVDITDEQSGAVLVSFNGYRIAEISAYEGACQIGKGRYSDSAEARNSYKGAAEVIRRYLREAIIKEPDILSKNSDGRRPEEETSD